MTDNLNKFIPITKVDAVRREVWGRLASEMPDRTNEVFDYETSKPNFVSWSDSLSKVTDGQNLGNLRAMHGSVAAGKLIDISFDDLGKTIDIGAKVVDDAEWRKVEEGVYTGFSIGGGYGNRWSDPKNPLLKRYTAKPTEASLADLPAIPDTTFTMIKADGTQELRKFATVEGAADPASTPEPETPAAEPTPAPAPAGPDLTTFAAAIAAAVVAALKPAEVAPALAQTATPEMTKTAAPEEETPLRKMLDEQQSSLTKATGTIARLESEIEKLKGQLTPGGPTLSGEALKKLASTLGTERTLGTETTPPASQSLSKIAVLEDLQKTTHDPALRQSLGKEIAFLKTLEIQQGPPTLNFGQG